MTGRPPRSWEEASRRLTRVSLLALPAIAALGGGVGYASGGSSAAIALAVIFPIVLTFWLLVVRSVGRRQWAKRDSGQGCSGEDA